MLSKSFKSGKCKTSLKLAVSRIKLLKNRREIQTKQLKRELAQLLAAGQEQTARIRVEHVIREEKTTSAYDLIEIYCELIVARLPIIESQKSCPIDLKEAISSVIFASPRCADIPELADARKQFVAKYGKEFVTSALELRPDSGVNRMIVEKLSAKAPDTETKMKVLAAIAEEHEVKWDSKAFEELQKPKEDLLNVSSSFVGANNMPMERLNANFSPNSSQIESASKVSRTDIISNHSSFDSSSHANNLRSSAPLVPLPVPKEHMESDAKSGASDMRTSFQSEETTYLKQQNWKMEFKDAASAAQVAAESAERASLAARAAAELASRGNFSRQNSNDPNGSSVNISRDERPNRTVSTKLKGEHSESANMEYDQGFQGMREEELRKLPKVELIEETSHHRSTFDDGKQYNSQVDNVKTFDGHRESFSSKEKGNKKTQDEAGFVEKIVEVNYSGSTSGSHIGTLDDDSIWVPPIDKHQTGNHGELGHNSSEIGSGEALFRYNDAQHASSDFSMPVFDVYSSDPTDDKENLLDSYDKIQNDQPSIFAESSSDVNSNIFSSPLTESHPPVTVERVPSSKFDDDVSATYDDSDGSSKSENGTSISLHNETAQSSRLLREKSGMGGDLKVHLQEELQPLSSKKVKTPLGAEEKNHLQVSSSLAAKDTEIPDDLASRGDLGLNFGRLTGGLRNRGYNHLPYSTKQTISPWEKLSTSSLIADDLSNSISTEASPNVESNTAIGSVSEDYSQQNRDSKTFSLDKSEENITSSSLKQFVSNQEKNRQYGGSNSNPSKQVLYDSSSVSDVFRLGETPTASEVIDQKIHDEKPNTKAYKELGSRLSKMDFNSDSDLAEQDSHVNMGNRQNVGSNTAFQLSRRTRDFVPKGRTNLPMSTDNSDMPSSKNENQSPQRDSAPENLSSRRRPVPLNQSSRRSPVPENQSSRGSPELESTPSRTIDGTTHQVLVHKENKKIAVVSPDSDASSINSANKRSDSDSGTKLKEASQQKSSHVHPKLPDYETLAAHFHSLRSNRRQL